MAPFASYAEEVSRVCMRSHAHASFYDASHLRWRTTGVTRRWILGALVTANFLPFASALPGSCRAHSQTSRNVANSVNVIERTFYDGRMRREGRSLTSRRTTNFRTSSAFWRLKSLRILFARLGARRRGTSVSADPACDIPHTAYHALRATRLDPGDWPRGQQPTSEGEASRLLHLGKHAGYELGGRVSGRRSGSAHMCTRAKSPSCMRGHAWA